MSMPSGATTILAKTTRPEIGNVLPRERLFQQLDGTSARKVAWISGPAGTGKSTLAASYVEARNLRWAWYEVDRDDDDVASFFYYLTYAARHLQVPAAALPHFDASQVEDLASFARAYFRTLFAKAGPATALVLDNLHALAPDSGLHAVLEAGLSQVPPGCCVVITSRAGPPAAGSRMRAGGEMVCISGESMRVTEDELAGIAHLRGGVPLAADTLRAMQERAQGWAAGLVLMLEHAKVTDRVAEPPVDATPAVVFDYLAGEIFDRFEASTRRFLLSIACLPRMTADVARDLSGEPTAARLLRNLVLNDYFVRELVGGGSNVFVLHPLLRQFLLGRAAIEWPEAIGNDALRHAARLLHDAGLAEEAVELHVESGDWAGVAAIAVEQGPALLATGRRATLTAWLELLPPELLGSEPALSCAYAESRLHASPRAARHYFEQAFQAARQRDDTQHCLRACSGVVDAIVLEFDDLAPLDRWTGELARLLAQPGAGDARAATSLAKALLLRDPLNPALAQWIERSATTSAQQDVRAIALARVAIALTAGDYARALAVGGTIQAAPRDVTGASAAMLGAALLQLLDGDRQLALQHARSGLATLGEEGGRGHATWLRLIATAALLGTGAHDDAQREIDAIDSATLRRGDRALLHYLRGWSAWLLGDTTAALREMKGALLLAVETGIFWMEALARLALAQLHGTDDLQSAQAQLRGAWANVARLGSVPLRIATELADAASCLAGAGEAAACTPLARGLALAREHGLRHVPGIERATLAALCALAMRNNIEPEFVRALVRADQLPPPSSAVRLKQWPWRFRIEMLGRFALLRGTNPVEFSAKGPGRPIELLKVMAALGGTGVRAEQLAEMLWPNVDADYAYKSFTATLHRLRRIFDDDDTVLLRDGRLSLNRNLVWLDAWALDEVITDMESQLRVADGRAATTAQALVEEALGLYRGAFLPDEDDQPVYAAKREQLRNRMVRNVARYARGWEEGGATDAAIDCWSRFVDADELCEAFHRHLMASHQRQGDFASAISAYERLRNVLAARLKTQPSPETQAAYAALRA